LAELPFDPAALSPLDKAIYDAMMARRKSQGAPFGGPYAALMNHPQLCQKIEELGYYLKFEGHLARDVYQFVVLAVARETKTAFEWVDHVQHAVAAGVAENVIETLRVHGVAGADYPDPYRLAALVLRSTLAWQNIYDGTQADAIASHGLLGFVEMVVLSGFYQMFSAINQGFDVSLPEGTAPPF
jgi:4-carboxymuconolactone decarboxylase